MDSERLQNLTFLDVTPRDGLQNEKTPVDTAQKLELINHSIEAGFKEIEVAAAVNPQRVPQMADTLAVLNDLPVADDWIYWVLVPNEKGLDRLKPVEDKFQGVAFFTSASETFSQRNSGCSIEESRSRFEGMVKILAGSGKKLRIYVSAALGCPFEGRIPAEQVRDTILRFLEVANDDSVDIAVSDTIGTGTPTGLEKLLALIREEVPGERLSVHLHDTYGQGLPNCLKALEAGIKKFDVSAGGLGGCPFAPGAGGNLAAEKLLYALQGSKYLTGMDLRKTIAYGNHASEIIGRKNPFAALPKNFLDQ